MLILALTLLPLFLRCQRNILTELNGPNIGVGVGLNDDGGKWVEPHLNIYLRNLYVGASAAHSIFDDYKGRYRFSARGGFSFLVPKTSFAIFGGGRISQNLETDSIYYPDSRLEDPNFVYFRGNLGISYLLYNQEYSCYSKIGQGNFLIAPFAALIYQVDDEYTYWEGRKPGIVGNIGVTLKYGRYIAVLEHVQNLYSSVKVQVLLWGRGGVSNSKNQVKCPSF